MPKHAPFSPSVSLSLMFGLILALLCVDLVTEQSTAIIFKEAHAFDVASALLLGAIAGLWWYARADDMQGRQWHLPVILLLMMLRELDFDKRFTSLGLLKLRLYTGSAPLWEKAIGLAVIALILICAWRLMVITVPRWWAGLRAGHASSWLAGAAALMLVLAKTLDGLDRKLAGFGIVLPEDLGRIIGRAAEIMELGVAIMLMQALVVFLRDRSPNAKQGAPAGQPAATGPSARYH